MGGYTHVADAGRRVTQNNHRRTVVVVHEGPEVATRANYWPFCDNVLPWVSVALQTVQPEIIVIDW